MSRVIRWRSGALAGALAVALAGHAQQLEEIIVRADASVAASHGAAGSVSVLGEADIALARANHPSELLARVPGVWVARGSGQEHLTAIRSGVHTGAGACGEFLLLENGVPIRPAGFCNVNNLFELNTEQAAAVEVARGPAGALFGGNAVHGVVNVVSATEADGWEVGVEAGPYDYLRGRLSAGGDAWRLDAATTSTAGYRERTGYGQHKATFSERGAVGAWDVVATATATLLNQETGGYVRGFKAYDGSARRSNPNPEAYRDAWSARAASVFRRDLAGRYAVVWTPYLRRSSMTFLQHWLPGQPFERNGQTSGGAMLRLVREGDRPWSAGVFVEAFAAELLERQDGPTVGSAFLVATRPAGTHYDYRANGYAAAAFFDVAATVAPRWELVASGRYEANVYDYDNRHLDGNGRDDGAPCGFGGCLYTRPADRRDRFENLAGRLGLRWSPRLNQELYLAAAQGFRPPQTTELYRLQNGQAVADLDSETVRAVEAGWRGVAGNSRFALAAYAEATRHLILRDASGFNVSDGATDSAGLEASLDWRLGAHALRFAISHARHRYGFTRDVAGRERIVAGNAVDSAPRWLGSAHWRWRSDALTSELEVVHVGRHPINAANTAHYDGHTLLNWRGAWRLTPRLSLFARLLNMSNAAYAERADYAFGGYRYFPGMPRRAYLGIEGRRRRAR